MAQLQAALAGPFDAILTVDSLGLWLESVQRLMELRQRLAPGGRLAIVAQPRRPGATRATSFEAARAIEGQVRAAGFADVRTQLLELASPAVCVIAVKRASAQVTL